MSGGFMLLMTLSPLVVELISQKKAYTFSAIRDHTIPKSLKCSISAPTARVAEASWKPAETLNYKDRALRCNLDTRPKL